jgi:flagellar protein FliT
MDPRLLTYYEAIERASADMLNAARAGNWDEVVKLEGACVLLISQLKHAAQEPKPEVVADVVAQLPASVDDVASAEAAKTKSRIMQRILVNDAEIRQLAEPWLQTLDEALGARRRTLH